MAPNSTPKSSIAKKIAEVTAAVKHPPQTGRNKHLNYDYSTRDDIFGVIRGELAQRGVAVMPSVIAVQREPTGASTRSGSPTMRVTVEVEIALSDGDEQIVQSWQGEAHTHDDKGVPQAVTQALRFWAVNTFMLLDGSEDGMYRNASSTPSNARSASTPEPQEVPAPQENTREAIVAFLSGIGFKTEQIVSFGQWIAARENAPNIKAVPDDRLPVYLASLRKRSEEDARKMVMAKIKSKDAA